MQQTIRFIKSADGVRLAVATSGSGAPLVKSANWLSHLEFDWQSPVWRHWFRFLSSGRQLIRFDPRGCGLSDWNAEDLSHEAQVADLEAIVAASDLDRFPLLGVSQGGAACIEYAVRHPERVTRLVLHGGFSRGWARRGPDADRAGRAWAELVRIGWGELSTAAYRRVFAELFIPNASEEQMSWFGEMQRRSTTPEIAARIMEASGNVDVADRLALVRAPTLVMHPRADAVVPFDQGRRLAAGIPGAKFVEFDSANHVLLGNEPAWTRFLEVVGEFLGWPREAPRRRVSDAPAAHDELATLTAREREILDLVAGGANNQAIADQLFISEKTVRNHLTAIFDKIGVSSRSQAIVFARDRGLAAPH